MKAEKTTKVLISTKTWSRDSYNLFDYESRLLNKQHKHLAQNTCSILRSGNNIDFFEHSQEAPFEQSNSEIIAKIEQTKGQFIIKSGKQEGLWRVINSTGQGHELHKNETIKLGRIMLQVTHLKTKGSEKFTQDFKIANEGGLCRICFCDDNTEENPLIVPCKCTGTMKDIHLGCLQTWINSKVTKSMSGCSVRYSWQNMICEICQEPIPFSVNCKGPKAFLTKIEALGSPYIVLEAVEKDKSKARALHLIQFNTEDVFKLGRGHESDIKFNDISVSRFHASLTYSSGRFMLNDNRSKFGTLVKISESYDIRESVRIQAGRTLMLLKIVDEDIL